MYKKKKKSHLLAQEKIIKKKKKSGSKAGATLEAFKVKDICPGSEKPP